MTPTSTCSCSTEEPDGEQPKAPRILAERGLDLTARAREGAIGRLDGRDDLVRRLLLALADPERSSVLLVGPHAVGKTALVHEAAARIAAGDVPASLKDAALWRLSANELIAGAQYTGMWQDRAKMLIDALRGGPAICFMDDPVPILDAGRWSQSDNNVSRFLRPYMESGDISIICETTAEGLAAVPEEPSFVEAFHRIDVRAEPRAHPLPVRGGRGAPRHGLGDRRRPGRGGGRRAHPPLRAVPGVPARRSPRSRRPCARAPAKPGSCTAPR